MLSSDGFDYVGIFSCVRCCSPRLGEALLSIRDSGQVFIDWRWCNKDDSRLLCLYRRMLNYFFDIFPILIQRYMLRAHMPVWQASIIGAEEYSLPWLS